MRKLFAISILLFLTAGLYAQKPVFNHVAMYVADLQKSKAFYEKVVGLDTIVNPFRDDKHAWFDIGGGTALHIIAGAKTITTHHQDNHLCFRVPAVEPFIVNLKNAGVSYVNAQGKMNEVTIRPDGVKQVYFKDPDGHWIEINDAK